MKSIVHRAIHQDTGEPAIDGKKETPIYSNKLIRKAHHMIQCYLQVFAKETFNSAVISKQPCTSPLWCYFVSWVFSKENDEDLKQPLSSKVKCFVCIPCPMILANLSTFSWKDVQHWANDKSVSSFKAKKFCHFHLRLSVSYNLSITGQLENSLEYIRKSRNKSYQKLQLD